MNLRYLNLFILIVSTQCVQPKEHHTRIAHQWKLLEFSFPTEFDRKQAEAGGDLKPTNTLLIDVQPHYYNQTLLRTFVTLRYRAGTPYTLATVSEKMGANGPFLEPYPNYETHNNKNGKNCDAIVSAFRVAINECNQLWVLDSGVHNSVIQCPPQLLLFDLKTDQLIYRYRFIPSLYIPGASLFITPVVNVRDPPPRGSCKHTMIYVADVSYHGLVVYDFMQNNAWRIENMFMYPDPNHGLHTIAGESFMLMDGIFGMATDKRNLYFHPFASTTEYAVPLQVIDNSTLFEHDVENMYEAFRPLGKRSSACAASAMDSSNNLYCVTLNPIELLKWNVNTPYDSKNLKKLHIKSAELQFVSGMKVVRNHRGNEELWMVSNRYQKIASGTRNFNEVNFRVVVLNLSDVGPTSPREDLHNKLIFKG